MTSSKRFGRYVGAVALLAPLLVAIGGAPTRPALGATALPGPLMHTLAGTGANGFGGDGGPATGAQLHYPRSSVPGPGGTFYIADTANNRVRKVDASGTITTYAGSGPGTSGFSGDGGQATQAELTLPNAVAVDAAGNVYIADTYNQRIRRVDTNGIITTIAGAAVVTTPLGGHVSSRSGAYSGDGGPATEAHLNIPRGVDVDGAGNVYIADTQNNRIRRVDPLGTITTVAGTGVPGYDGDGGAATLASFRNPFTVDVDRTGNLWIADSFNNRIRRVDAGADGIVSGSSDETVTTVAGNGTSGSSGDGGPATQAALSQPEGAGVDDAGNLYIADTWNHRIRKVDAAGTITTVAGTGTAGTGGDGGPAAGTQVAYPTGINADGGGNVYFGDANGRIRVIGALSVAVRDDPDPVFVGRPLTYTATVGNYSPLEASNVVITDVLPPQLSFESATPSQGTCSERRGRVTCTLGVLAAGAAATVEVAVVPKEAGMVANTVSGDASHPDAFVVDDADTEETLVRPASVFLTNDDSPDPAQVGDGDITYRLTVENGLWDPATDVRVTDTLPQEVSFRSATASQGTCSQRRGTVTCALGTIESGASATVDIVVIPVSPGLVVNTASVKARNFRTPASASAETQVSAADCATVVTDDTVLQADVGPCARNGLIVGADGITVDLGGHRIFGFAGPSPTDPHGLVGNAAGVRLPMRTGVTVKNGTISDFDAGVVINGGGSNTVSGITARDNIGVDEQSSFLGDGIVLFNSTNNRIVDNQVIHNGHYDGIGVLGPGSDGNVVEGNVVEDNIGSGRDPASRTGQGIIFNGFEVPDANDSISNSRVEANIVRRNGSAGISNTNTADGVIRSNVVENNGVTNAGGNGIGAQVTTLLDADLVTELLIQHNEIHGNAENGIQMYFGGGNKVLDNDAANNNTAGVPWFFDLHDRNSGCAGTIWYGNRWGIGYYDPFCTTAGGSGPEPPGGIALTLSSSLLFDLPYRQVPPPPFE